MKSCTGRGCRNICNRFPEAVEKMRTAFPFYREVSIASGSPRKEHTGVIVARCMRDGEKRTTE